MNGMTEQLDTTAAQSTLPPVLTIAGSDSSGGAGIQADLKTMLANGVFGMSAITAITAQNTMGVTGVQNITPDMVAAQIDAVYTDIPPAAVKIGMVSSAELICTIADRLEAHHARHIVLDPVMVATSGAKLIDDDAITALTERLFPLAEVITPNIPETEVLLDLIAHRGASLDPAKWAEDTDRESTRIVSDTAMEDAGRTVSEHYGCAVLVKCGHGVADASDLLYADGVATWIHGRARGQSEHAWHRMHAVVGDRLESGQRRGTARRDPSCQGLSDRSARRAAEPRPRFRADGPRMALALTCTRQADPLWRRRPEHTVYTDHPTQQQPTNQGAFI